MCQLMVFLINFLFIYFFEKDVCEKKIADSKIELKKVSGWLKKHEQLPSIQRVTGRQKVKNNVQKYLPEANGMTTANSI